MRVVLTPYISEKRRRRKNMKEEKNRGLCKRETDCLAYRL